MRLVPLGGASDKYRSWSAREMSACPNLPPALAETGASVIFDARHLRFARRELAWPPGRDGKPSCRSRVARPALVRCAC
jgi:hypothetical protein